MASPSSSKPKKGLRNLLKETLHVRSRSKSPSQLPDKSQQPDLGHSAGPVINPAGTPLAGNDTAETRMPVAKINHEPGSKSITGSAGARISRLALRSNPVWTTLRRSLEELRDSSNVLPALSSVIEELLSSFDELEITARNWPDYEELAAGLTKSSNSLIQPVRESGTIPLPDATLNPIIIELASDCSSIKALFDKLQANLSDGAWNTENTTKIASASQALTQTLDPVMWPTYDSDQGEHPLRRCCLEGSRTEVLAKMEEWLNDTGVASICSISGAMGIGKTTIAYTLCNKISDRRRLAASIFYEHGSVGWDAVRVVKAIAFQLGRYSALFQRALCDSFADDLTTAPSDMLELFQKAIKRPYDKAKGAMPEGVVIVIDGLDKWEDGSVHKLIANTLFRYTDGIPLKILLTSRDRPEPPDGSPFSAIHLDDIPRSVVRSDISLYLGTELSPMELTSTQLEQLTDRTDMLFLCATLLVRFITLGDSQSSSRGRLALILSMTLESTKKHAFIDGLYAAILRSILGEDKAKEDEIRVVLWTVLFAQGAIDVETIAMLGGIDGPKYVRSALQPLRPVLVYSEESGLVSTLHTSFPEFILNTNTSGMFFCDLAEHSRMISERCFNVMKAGLRFNICEIQSSFTPDRGVEGLQGRIIEKISPTLLYACRYWASHLELAAVCHRSVKGLEDFLSFRLLFWMEVLSLKREMRTGVVGLMKVKRWMKLVGSAFPEIAAFVEDAYDFVSSYAANPISQSTPHIYISALPFCPRSSRVYHSYSKRTTRLLELAGNMLDHRETAALAAWKPEAISVAYSPDGNQIGFGDWGGSAGIRDAYDGSPLIELSKCHTLSVSSVAFSADGLMFSTGSYDRTIRVWNAKDGAPILGPLQAHTAGILSVAFSPDCKLIASGSMDRTACIWAVSDGTLRIGPLRGYKAVVFSPDGSHLATPSENHSVSLWDIGVSPPSATKLIGHTSDVATVAFCPDGMKVVSGSTDGTIRIWNILDGTCARELIGHQSHITKVSISPDGGRIVSSSWDGTIRVWSIDHGKLVAGPFHSCSNPSYDVAYSPSEARVVSGSAALGRSSLQVWSIREGVFSPTLLPSLVFAANSITLSPSESRIFTTSSHIHGVRVWDINDGTLLVTLPSALPQPTFSLPLSPDGTLIAVFLDDYSVEVLSTKDGTSIAGPFHGHTDGITSAAFSANGRYLVTGSEDCTVRVWDLQENRPPSGRFVGHTSGTNVVSLSSDGSRVISSSKHDYSIRVWNVRDSMMHADIHGPAGSSSSASVDDHLGVLEGWKVQSDGWVTNGDGLLLFWIPLNFLSKPSPHTELIIDRYGSLKVAKQKLRMGYGWAQCYVDDEVPQDQ